jgi:hypothetical protein
MDDTTLALAGVIAAAFVGFIVIFNLATAAVGALLGASVDKIQFGLGPSVRLARLGGMDIRATPLMLGGSVMFRPRADGSWASWPVQAIVALVGPFGVIAAAALVLGQRVVDAALSTWPDMIAIVTSPRPADVFGALTALIAARGHMDAVATVMTKFAAFNLAPLPIFAGGAFLLALIEGLIGAARRNALMQRLAAPSLIVMLVWCVAFLWRAFAGAFANA